eukprot:Polyplicarium_translucidae@DN2999_c0_g1_i1.p2
MKRVRTRRCRGSAPPAAGNGGPVAEERGAAPLSEYAQWMAAEETDAVPEGRARKLWRAATGAMTGAVDRAKKAAISMWRSTLPVAFRCLGEEDPDHRGARPAPGARIRIRRALRK